MLPVALMLIGMPVSGSIGHSIGLGMVSYTVIKVFSGKAREVSVLTYVICYWGHTFGILVEADIRRDLFRHMQELG